MHPLVFAVQQVFIYNTYWEMDAVYITYQEHWMIGTDGERERERERSALSTWLDDDIDVLLYNITLFIFSHLLFYLSIYLSV